MKYVVRMLDRHDACIYREYDDEGLMDIHSINRTAFYKKFGSIEVIDKTPLIHKLSLLISYMSSDFGVSNIIRIVYYINYIRALRFAIASKTLMERTIFDMY